MHHITDEPGDDLELKTFTVGGVKVSCVDCRQATENFFRLVSSHTGGYVILAGAHGIVEAKCDQRLFKIINNARMFLPDGMPVQWIGRLKRAEVTRFHGIDFFRAIICDPRGAGIRHYFYGGTPEITSRISSLVTLSVGADAVCGWHSPPFRAAGVIEDAGVIAQIAATRPDVIWVSLSTPKQDYWMANHTTSFPGTLLVGVGAAYDYFAGPLKRAPWIMQQAGLEWLVRLAQEPRRLWPRYRRVVPAMLKIIFAEALASALTRKRIGRGS